MMGLLYLKTGQEIVLGHVFVPLLILMTPLTVGSSFPSTGQFLQLQEEECWVFLPFLLHHQLLLEVCTPYWSFPRKWGKKHDGKLGGLIQWCPAFEQAYTVLWHKDNRVSLWSIPLGSELQRAFLQLHFLTGGITTNPWNWITGLNAHRSSASMGKGLSKSDRVSTWF